jgi:hypothetical protein
MKDPRKDWYHHPKYGLVRKDAQGYYEGDTETYISPEAGLESMYERDQRLFVEQAVMGDLIKSDEALPDRNVEVITKYYMRVYDVIQKTLKENGK